MTSPFLSGLSLTTCERPPAPGTGRTAGGAPEWLHLFADGKMTGQGGRSFDLVDPGAVVRAFQSANLIRGIDLPIDDEHANDRPEVKTGGPVPAAGRIREPKADDTGLWDRVGWTATAAEPISNREYRFLSPSFLHHAETGAIARLIHS